MFRHVFRKNMRVVAIIRHLFIRRSSTNNRTTIYALSSGYGKCGVAVIRISGPRAFAAIDRMTKTSQMKPRWASLKKIYDPETNQVLDMGLCLWFPEPDSFTGENSTELHVHGGLAVISSILSALSKLKFVPAAPGEFTKRAFLNGKLDLTAAEGIGDLINAETEKQRRQASDQANGSLRKLYDSWRNALLTSLASLEAHVDFSEEYGLQSSVAEKTNASLRHLCREIGDHLSDNRKGEILRNGIKVAIMGEPNVGKSSLLNLLSGRNAAIVNPSPGTTRDILELTIDILGYPMIIADTAGIRTNARDEIEIEGIRRAKEKVLNADLVICMVNAKLNIGVEPEEYLEHYKKSLGLERKRVLIAVNKSDLVTEEIKKKWRNKNCVTLSCKTGEGIKDLTHRLAEHFTDMCGNPSEENPLISHERYRNHLSRTVDHCKAYFDRVEAENFDIAISLQDIRNAANEIGHITGHVTGEEILNAIFKKFCIGK